MKVLSSLKSAKNRSRDCQVVRRRGKLFVICKSDKRLKARQRSGVLIIRRSTNEPSPSGRGTTVRKKIPTHK